MMSLFPLIDAPDTGAASTGALPLAREVAWDFVRDQSIWRSGKPLTVTGEMCIRDRMEDV